MCMVFISTVDSKAKGRNLYDKIFDTCTCISTPTNVQFKVMLFIRFGYNNAPFQLTAVFY